MYRGKDLFQGLARAMVEVCGSRIAGWEGSWKPREELCSGPQAGQEPSPWGRAVFVLLRPNGLDEAPPHYGG